MFCRILNTIVALPFLCVIMSTSELYCTKKLDHCQHNFFSSTEKAIAAVFYLPPMLYVLAHLTQGSQVSVLTTGGYLAGGALFGAIAGLGSSLQPVPVSGILSTWAWIKGGSLMGTWFIWLLLCLEINGRLTL